MNRRGFLATIAAALVADPEKLLWEPNKKFISIPRPSREWMQMIVNPRQAPGVIDFIDIKDWFRIKTKVSDYYEVDKDRVTGYLECRLALLDQFPKTPAYRSH
jgi:hypothetical protein